MNKLLEEIKRKENENKGIPNITVCFEGVDGAGKSTASMVFEGSGNRLAYEQPYNNVLYKEIYDLLKTDKITKKEKMEIYHLQMSHLSKLIQMEEPTNKTITIDRFFQSTYVYQNLDYKEYKDFTRYLIKPDITFIFDVDWDTYCLRRPDNNADDIYENDLDRITFEERRARYKFLAEVDDDTFLIDGTQAPTDVMNHINSIYREYMFKLHIIS